jgi:acyl carrier protein phosphodiesterase
MKRWNIGVVECWSDESNADFQYSIFPPLHYSIKFYSMNFLAHAFLSDNQHNIIIGNFLADFLRGRKAVEDLPKAIQQGIAIHRKIDKFTDKHPIVKQGIERLKHTQGRYSSVLIDVFYDYFLAKNWSTFSPTPLPEFTADIYSHLETEMHLFPKSLQKRLPEMISHDWLVRYGEIEGLKFTFSKMSNRTSFEDNFHLATDDLLRFEKEFNEEFLIFFPELLAYTNRQIKKLDLSI